MHSKGTLEKGRKREDRDGVKLIWKTLSEKNMNTVQEVPVPSHQSVTKEGGDVQINI